MRQAIALLVGAALVAVAAVLPAPEVPEPPEVVPPEYPGTATDLGFCPTWTVDDVVASALVLAVAEEIEASLDFQADDEVLTEGASRSGAGTVSADPGLAQGYVPVLVDGLSGDPVAAGVVTTGDGLLAASACARWSAVRWTVGVGGTLEGESTTLVLHNPSVQASTVAIEVFSDQGLEIGEGFGSVTVPPLGALELPVTGDLRLRERLVFVVDDPAGAIVPAIDHRAGGTDRAVAVGVPEAIEWFFPTTGGAEGELVLVNAGTESVAVEVDLFRPDGAELGATAILLEPRAIEVVPLDGGAGIRVRADEPVGAAVRTESGGGLGATMGLSTEAVDWALPGLGVGPGQPTMAILNVGAEAVDVTYRVLGPGGATAGRTISVAGGTVSFQELEIQNASGVLVEASAPVTVGWHTTVPGGPLGVAPGIPRG